MVDMFNSTMHSNGDEDHDNYLDMELENLTTFCLTSACYDPEDFCDSMSEDIFDFNRDYDMFKPVMVYF